MKFTPFLGKPPLHDGIPLAPAQSLLELIYERALAVVTESPVLVRFVVFGGHLGHSAQPFAKLVAEHGAGGLTVVQKDADPQLARNLSRVGPDLLRIVPQIEDPDILRDAVVLIDSAVSGSAADDVALAIAGGACLVLLHDACTAKVFGRPAYESGLEAAELLKSGFDGGWTLHNRKQPKELAQRGLLVWERAVLIEVPAEPAPVSTKEEEPEEPAPLKEEEIEIPVDEATAQPPGIGDGEPAAEPEPPVAVEEPPKKTTRRRRTTSKKTTGSTTRKRTTSKKTTGSTTRKRSTRSKTKKPEA